MQGLLRQLQPLLRAAVRNEAGEQVAALIGAQRGYRVRLLGGEGGGTKEARAASRAKPAATWPGLAAASEP